MKKDKLYYTEFHVAGVQYYEANEVMDRMKNGDKVRLVRDEDNHHDKEAIAIFYDDTHIGYVPRTETDKFVNFIDMGWGDIFETRISALKPDSHPESQIYVRVKILRKGE